MQVLLGNEDGRDDVQPLLDFIKKSAEHDENVISDLCSKRFPLGVIGKLLNKNTVKVSDMVRSFKGEIFTCIGTAEAIIKNQ
ncbi:hypothetical protein P4117_13790 [Pseudomonas aeruginosa]|nr:hypothetical protein [Pseudomonas aeruginosa]